MRDAQRRVPLMIVVNFPVNGQRRSQKRVEAQCDEELLRIGQVRPVRRHAGESIIDIARARLYDSEFTRIGKDEIRFRPVGGMFRDTGRIGIRIQISPEGGRKSFVVCGQRRFDHHAVPGHLLASPDIGAQNGDSHLARDPIDCRCCGLGGGSGFSGRGRLFRGNGRHREGCQQNCQ